MQTVNEAAVVMQVSTRRIRRLCEQGRIAGAKRLIIDGGMRWWEIPDVIAIQPGKRGPKLRHFQREE